MAIINYTNQLKFTGSGPLDAKNTPVRTYSELPSIPAQRYLGMEVTVLNGSGGKPEEYWFIGKDKFNGTWVRKIDGFGLNLSDDGALTLTYNGESLSATSASLKSYIEESIKQWGDDNYIEKGEVKIVEGVPVLTISYKDTEMAPLEIPLGIFATKEYVDSEIEKIIATSGAQGDKGVQGDAGDKGAQGEAGDKGVQGEAGDKGVQGDAGEKGAQGEAGDKGVQGDAGEKGAQGEAGDKGVQGDAGEKGAQGEAGDKGVQGEAGDKGVQGDAGDKGVQGDAGDKGVQGEAGDKGVQGDAGDKGVQGEPGVMGLQGFMGIQGEKGTQADRGAQGEQGVQGEKGDSGEGLTYIDEDE